MPKTIRHILLAYAAFVWLLCSIALSVLAKPIAYQSEYAEKTVVCAVTSSDYALPVQVEKVRTPVVQRTARQQQRWLSDSIFSFSASRVFSRNASMIIILTRTIAIALPAYEISFPFSSFW